MKVWCAGVCLRILAISVGEWIDKKCEVKYTDVDYWVYRDAAKLIINDRSPYERAGYRYSPLYAFVLTPEVVFGWRAVGKLIFALIDAIVVGPGITRLCQERTCKKDSIRIGLYGWALNPLAINICTRGSSEAIIIAVVIAALRTQASPVLSGALLGLGVHLKIYPILYLPGFVLALPLKRQRLIFFSSSALAFALTTYLSMRLYPHDYLQNAIMYHLNRIDYKHNFSIFWLPFFFAQENINALNEEHAMLHNVFLRYAPTLFSGFIQIATLTYLAKHDLIACTFAQTLLFVTFNKVCTAQYFIWWFPLALICTSASLFSSADAAYRILMRATALWTTAYVFTLNFGL